MQAGGGHGDGRGIVAEPASASLLGASASRTSPAQARTSREHTHVASLQLGCVTDALLDVARIGESFLTRLDPLLERALPRGLLPLAMLGRAGRLFVRDRGEVEL